MSKVLIFISGVFFSNALPHFINGISGRKFHSPFAKPFVKGLSSAFSNTVWGVINLVTGYICYIAAGGLLNNNSAIYIFAAGLFICALSLSVLFSKINKNN